MSQWNVVSFRTLLMLAGLVALAQISTLPVASAGDPPDVPEIQPFQKVALHVEYNVVDDDAEVVFVIDAGVGLKYVKAFAPNGKQVLFLSSKTKPNLGLTKIQMETPEPSLNELKAAYPAGVYKFRGKTVEDDTIVGEATLSHKLLPAPTINAPTNGATNVPLNNVIASWNAVTGVDKYFLEVEQEDLGIVLKTDVVPTSATFAIPNDWLLPDKEYVFNVAAVSPNGNYTIDEVRFHTAP